MIKLPGNSGTKSTNMVANTTRPSSGRKQKSPASNYDKAVKIIFVRCDSRASQYEHVRKLKAKEFEMRNRELEARNKELEAKKVEADLKRKELAIKKRRA
ncbi:hypothetical protein CRG98_008165 [Punica granatum]|uniref:Uncharacterized protein n=1 Tax=Punica granatum TaxID=22663 RepID=A0A2I0KSN1_PUNGR|nr:hypothetical protein CRG98_008165 [Punica granatum]